MVTYYLQVGRIEETGGHGLLWEVHPGGARRADITHTDEVHDVEPGQDVLASLQSRFPNYTFHKLDLSPGEYFPRIARPSSAHPYDHAFNPDNIKNRNLIATSQGQLMALREQLERVCRVVQPVRENWNAFGHELRNLLILACTEIEAHCRGTLLANGARAETTNDYVKLCPAMRLDKYAVEFPHYPWLDAITPFEGWPVDAPTKSLRWYDAYNAVKHDREREFARGTLGHAFEAIAGCAVMIAAQFGWVFGIRQQRTLNSYFEFKARPDWQPNDVYAPQHVGMERRFPFPRNYDFASQ